MAKREENIHRAVTKHAVKIHIGKPESYNRHRKRSNERAQHTERVPLAEGRRLFPGKCVLGGFDNRAGSLINNGTKEDIQTFARELVKQNAQPGIMIGADCTLPATIDPARIQWVVDAVANA